MSRSFTLLGFAMLTAASLGCVERHVETIRTDGEREVRTEERTILPADTHDHDGDHDHVVGTPAERSEGADIRIDGPRRSIDIETGPGGADVDVDRKPVDDRSGE